MKHTLLLFTALLMGLNSLAQISYEKGYFIEETGQKVEALILNVDWKYNPTKFSYKLSEDAEENTARIDDVQEFGIYDVSKYIRTSVNIDRSSNNLNLLDHDKEPKFKKETLFLKVLLEGKHNFYVYKEGNLVRYFYTTEHSNTPQQLVYKKYKTTNVNINTNNRYKQQVWSILQCSSITQHDFDRLNYKQNELLKLFKKYHECQNLEYTTFSEEANHYSFNVAVRPGVTSSSFEMQNSVATTISKNIAFPTETGFRLGVEAELVLPYNNRKWAVILEPTYQSYKSSKNHNYLNHHFATVTVDYSSIEVPVGVRHYFYLNDNSKLMFNIQYSFDFLISKSLYSEERDDLFDQKLKSRPNWILGAGYKFQDTYSIEFRYGTDRELMDGSEKSYISKFQSLSLVLGYKIF